MPNLAALAAGADVGRAAVIPAGMPPGSDVGMEIPTAVAAVHRMICPLSDAARTMVVFALSTTVVRFVTAPFAVVAPVPPDALVSRPASRGRDPRTGAGSRGVQASDGRRDALATMKA